MTDERVKAAIDALKAAPVCVIQMTGDGGGYEVCRWVERRLVVMETAPTAGSADVLKDEIDRRAKAEAVIAALDAHDGAPVGWRPIETAVCDDRFALVRWQDGHLTVEDLDHDSDPTWWKERGASQWCDVSELVNRGISPHTERPAVARVPGDAVKAALDVWFSPRLKRNAVAGWYEALMTRALAAADAARSPSEAEKRLAEIDERCLAYMRSPDVGIQETRFLGSIRGLATRPLDAPQVTPPDAATAPGHTDLMVPPEAVAAFMRDNPLPDEVVPFTREMWDALRWLLEAATEKYDGPKAWEAEGHLQAAFPSGREGGET